MNQLDTPFTVTVATEDRGPRLRITEFRIQGKSEENPTMASCFDASEDAQNAAKTHFLDTLSHFSLECEVPFEYTLRVV